MKLFTIRNLFALGLVAAVVFAYMKLKDIAVATNELGNENNIGTTVILVLTILMSAWLVRDSYKFIVSYK
jgi:hypothetical protein